MPVIFLVIVITTNFKGSSDGINGSGFQRCVGSERVLDRNEEAV